MRAVTLTVLPFVIVFLTVDDDDDYVVVIVAVVTFLRRICIFTKNHLF